MRVERILETCLYADDLAAGEKFYSEILGLQVFSRSKDRHVFFSCGQGVFLLFRATETERPASGVPPHGARGPGHVAFGIPKREMAGWRRHLGECGVAIEAEVSWPGGGHSIYFRDPAGNSVELATPQTWGLPEDER